LVKIINPFSAKGISSAAFNLCTALKEFRLRGLVNNVILSSASLISKETILYLIQNSEATSTITITLHADAYARLAEDADIVAALAEKEFVSLASA